MELLLLLLLLFAVIESGKITIKLGKNKKYKILGYIKYLIPIAYLIFAIIERNNYFVEIKKDCDGFGCFGLGMIPMFLSWFCMGQFIFTLGACILTSIKKTDKKEEDKDKFTAVHIVLVNILIYFFVIVSTFSLFD